MKKRIYLTSIFLTICAVASAKASLSGGIGASPYISRAALYADLGGQRTQDKNQEKKTETKASPEGSASEKKLPEGTLIPAGEPVSQAPVFEKTITTAPLEESGLYISNLAKADISISELLALPEEKKTGKVLILHTHGCEAYTPTKENNYEPTSDFRTVDTRFNVVTVGDKIEEILKAKGISVIHDRTLCDYPSYNDSYSNSLALGKSYVEADPDIDVILDVHRDSVEGSNGEQIKTVGAENTAQLMLVVGTDKSGLEHPLWRQNLSFALKLQKRITASYPTLMRPINLRAQRFNQHLTCGSLILEVGTDGNTLEEALNAASIFADELADYLL